MDGQTDRQTDTDTSARVELCFAAKKIQKFGIEVGNPVLRSSNCLVGLNLVVVPDKSVFLYIAHKGKFKKGKFEKNKMKYFGLQQNDKECYKC